MTRERIRNRNRFSRTLALESLEGRKLLSTTTVTLPTGAIAVSTFDNSGHLTGYEQTSPAGDLQWSQANRFNAAGVLVNRTTTFGDGFQGALADSSTVETYSGTSGRETSFTRTFGDGSMETATYSVVTGQETSSRAFDATGNLTADQLYIYSPNGGGLQSVSTTYGDGSTLFQSFYADGHEQSYVVTDAAGNVRAEHFADITI